MMEVGRNYLSWLSGAVVGLFLAVGMLSDVFACPLISAEKLKNLLKEDKCAFIIDVRHPFEFSKGHIENANLIPLDIFDYIYLSGLKNRTIVVYSEEGKRSEVACKKLQEMGISKIYNLVGGINAWKSLGFPIIHGYR